MVLMTIVFIIWETTDQAILQSQTLFARQRKQSKLMNADYKLLTSEVVKVLYTRYRSLEMKPPSMIFHTITGWRKNRYMTDIFYIYYIDPDSKLERYFVI